MIMSITLQSRPRLPPQVGGFLYRIPGFALFLYIIKIKHFFGQSLVVIYKHGKYIYSQGFKVLYIQYITCMDSYAAQTS